MCECRVCNVSKVRVAIGKRARNVTIFADQDGRQWNGRTCPTCQHAQIDAMRKVEPRKAPVPRKKYEESIEFGPKEVLNPPKLRACRTCNVMNPNYYECSDCRSASANFGCYDEDMFHLEGGHVGNKTYRAGFHY